MAFDEDAGAQMQCIRSNLQACSQTPPDERSRLLKSIDDALDGVADDVVTIRNIYAIGSAVRQLAEEENLYFLGSKHTVTASKQYFSTRAELKFISTISRAMDGDDLGLSVADQLDRAKSIFYELSDSVTFVAARQGNSAVPLHRHGSPMWVAAADDPLFGDAGWLAYVPARLGLGPDNSLPSRYVLMKVRIIEAMIPRFADSGAYPYWAPGGVTKPLEQCPVENGFEEVVADGIRIGSLDCAVVAYLRTI